jgi:hypothetical protein
MENGKYKTVLNPNIQVRAIQSTLKFDIIPSTKGTLIIWNFSKKIDILFSH